MRLRWALDKVAGFVDKSLRIDTNWAFLKKTISETNPQIESLRFGLTNPDLRWIQDSWIQIFMYLFRILVLKIRNHENRLNLLKIGWIRGPQLKTNLFKSGFVRQIHWYDSSNLSIRPWPTKSGIKRVWRIILDFPIVYLRIGQKVIWLVYHKISKEYNKLG